MKLLKLKVILFLNIFYCQKLSIKVIIISNYNFGDSIQSADSVCVPYIEYIAISNNVKYFGNNNK